MGSLVTAIASYCEARIHHGHWLVRMEDVDETRAVIDADRLIYQQLQAFGMQWDSEVIYQTQRTSAYANAFAELQVANLIYPCTCTRKEIADSAISVGLEGSIYPKNCLHKPIKHPLNPAYRIKTNDHIVTFHDAIYGVVTQSVSEAIGDFILKRADGYFAYQLAVVVDDHFQGVTHIVRGADLLESTPRQLYLQALLGYATPNYMHIPIVKNASGEKLSKHSQASPIALDASHPSLIGAQLTQALTFLGLAPPPSLATRPVSAIWDWTFAHWQTNTLQASINSL
jgi:glutamyl-Q tRNA(Asp) synthetase